jgi:hypothetical protein
LLKMYYLQGEHQRSFIISVLHKSDELGQLCMLCASRKRSSLTQGNCETLNVRRPIFWPQHHFGRKNLETEAFIFTMSQLTLKRWSCLVTKIEIGQRCSRSYFARVACHGSVSLGQNVFVDSMNLHQANVSVGDFGVA